MKKKKVNRKPKTGRDEFESDPKAKPSGRKKDDIMGFLRCVLYILTIVAVCCVSKKFNKSVKEKKNNNTMTKKKVNRKPKTGRDEFESDPKAKPSGCKKDYMMVILRCMIYILMIVAVCWVIFEEIERERKETCEVYPTDYNNYGEVNAWMKSRPEYLNQDIPSNNLADYGNGCEVNAWSIDRVRLLLYLLMMMIMMGMFVTGCESIHHANHVDSPKIMPPSLSSYEIPEDYTQFDDDDMAYKINEVETSWEEANYQCILDGGYLANADTPKKRAQIKGLNPKIHKSPWIGPSYASSAYNMVNVTEPLCQIMAKGSAILETPCTEKRPSVCEISRANRTQPTTQNSSGAKLPEGYELFSGHNVALKINHDKLTWQEASSRCNSDGGNLAIPDTLEKIRFIMSMLPYNDLLFVGVYNSAYSNEWLGVADNSPVTSLPWKIKPTAGSRLNCTIISWHGLISSDCNWKFKSVCEIHVPVDDTSSAAGARDMQQDKKIYFLSIFPFLYFLF